MATKIHPTGQQLTRLQKNTGLLHYTVNGDVAAETVSLPMGLLDIWTFWYVDIAEDVVREHMLKVTMGQRGLSKEAALDYLYRVRQGIPQDQVRIERG